MILKPDVFNLALYNVYASLKKNDDPSVDIIDLRQEDNEEVAQFVRGRLQTKWDDYSALMLSYNDVITDNAPLAPFLKAPYFHPVGPEFGSDLFGGEKLPDYTPPKLLSPELRKMRDEYYAWVAINDEVTELRNINAPPEEWPVLPPFQMIWNNPLGDNPGYDKEGFPINVSGDRIGFNAAGQPLDGDGDVINAQGEKVDESGDPIVVVTEPEKLPDDIEFDRVKDGQDKEVE